jgi:hypothetical protein
MTDPALQDLLDKQASVAAALTRRPRLRSPLTPGHAPTPCGIITGRDQLEHAW